MKKKFLSPLNSVGQIFFFMLNAVRRDWNKFVVAVAVAERLRQSHAFYLEPFSANWGSSPFLFLLTSLPYFCFSLHQAAMDYQVDM